MERIALFNVALDEGVKTFDVYSENFSVLVNGEDAYIDSSDEEIYQIMPDGSSEPFEVTATTWIGHKLNAFDAIGQLVSAYFNNDPDYEFLEIDPTIEQTAHNLEEAPVCVVNGHNISKYYYDFMNQKVYTLLLVTEEKVFYGYFEDVLYLDALTLDVLSNNYFAEGALRDTVVNIMNGTETVVWEHEDIQYIRDEIEEYGE